MSEFIKQIGAVPLLVDHGDIKTVLVTVKYQDNIWIFPKGHCEKEMTDEKTCSMEAYEEAGVTGKVRKKSCGTFRYSKLRRDYRVKYYPMQVKEVLPKWPESRQRKRAVVSIAEAMKMLRSEKLKKLLKRSVKNFDKE